MNLCCLPMPDVGAKPPVISQRANELMAECCSIYSGDPKVLNPAHKEEETKKCTKVVGAYIYNIDMCVYI